MPLGVADQQRRLVLPISTAITAAEDFDKRRPELVEVLSPQSTHKRLSTRMIS
jgi:hypothetical protein